jgi:isopenicillin N synthase-like dioxygenase
MKITTKVFLGFVVIILLLSVIFLLTNYSFGNLADFGTGIKQNLSISETSYKDFSSISQLKEQETTMLQEVLLLGYVNNQEDMESYLESFNKYYDTFYQQVSKLENSEQITNVLDSLNENVLEVFDLKESEIYYSEMVDDYKQNMVAEKNQEIQEAKKDYQQLLTIDPSKTDAILKQLHDFKASNPDPSEDAVKDFLKEINIRDLTLYECEVLWNSEEFEWINDYEEFTQLKFAIRGMMTEPDKATDYKTDIRKLEKSLSDAIVDSEEIPAIFEEISESYENVNQSIEQTLSQIRTQSDLIDNISRDSEKMGHRFEQLSENVDTIVNSVEDNTTMIEELEPSSKKLLELSETLKKKLSMFKFSQEEGYNNDDEISKFDEPPQTIEEDV